MQLLPPRMRFCFVIPEPISAHLISSPGTGKCQCYYLLSLSVSVESSDSLPKEQMRPSFLQKHSSSCAAPGRTPAYISLLWELAHSASIFTSSLFIWLFPCHPSGEWKPSINHIIAADSTKWPGQSAGCDRRCDHRDQGLVQSEPQGCRTRAPLSPWAWVRLPLPFMSLG